MAGFLTAALGKEPQILAVFFERYPQIDAEFTQRGEIKDQRVNKTHAMLAALFDAMALLFPNYLTAERITALQEYTYLRGVNRQQRMAADHPMVENFWEQYDFLNERVPHKSEPSYGYPGAEEIVLNHSNNPVEIAISLQHMAQVCDNARQERMDWTQLKKLLPSSRRHKFLGKKNVKSALLGKAVYCWVFENKDANQEAAA
jgi:hypothetical protein